MFPMSPFSTEILTNNKTGDFVFLRFFFFFFALLFLNKFYSTEMTIFYLAQMLCFCAAPRRAAPPKLFYLRNSLRHFVFLFFFEAITEKCCYYKFLFNLLKKNHFVLFVYAFRYSCLNGFWLDDSYLYRQHG